MATLIARKKTVHGGVPVVAGTRVPVSVLVSYSFEKDGLREAKSEYPQLTTRQILAAWKFAAQQLDTSVHDAPQKV